MENKKCKLIEIESIEEIGSFEDEYVYDLEMEDESHTFIANNILVHNTDSIFVGFKPAIDTCDWKNQLFNESLLNRLPKKYTIIKSNNVDFDFDINNSNLNNIVNIDNGISDSWIEENKDKILSDENEVLVIDGEYLKDYNLINIIKDFKGNIYFNWKTELEFIHGLDKFRIEEYFKKCLDKHAESYGVKNVQDFELEKISESIINLEKKKYIQNIIWEEGVNFKSLEYFQPKGVELVRSSTPVFARDKERGIPRIVKYLFSKPDSFNIKELIKIVKSMRREFELSEIDHISMQSSCSNYYEKVLNDKEKLEFVSGAHFAVKAAGFHNYLLNKEKSLQTKYNFLTSGDKIKYFYCKSPINGIFAYKRGDFPIEFAPEVDYDMQFFKAILSPINSIVKKLGMPEITKRISVVLDLFSNVKV